VLDEILAVGGRPAFLEPPPLARLTIEQLDAARVELLYTISII
jgi:hypothetical protein